MPCREHIHTTPDGRVIAECGPMRLTIQAWRGTGACPEIAAQGAQEAFRMLAVVAAAREELSRPIGVGRTGSDMFRGRDVPRRMLASVRAIGDDDLTPMAAVAGTLADAVADWLARQGLTKVIVDNGGDIALRLRQDAQAVIGLRPDVNSPVVSHTLHLDARSFAGGIATSGMGGRSLTRGIASAVSVLAQTASIADAAATAIANRCFVSDALIEQVPAETLDPATDIAGIPVTVKVGRLAPDLVAAALAAALARAQQLVHQNLIIAALMALQGCFVQTGPVEYFRARPIENNPEMCFFHYQPTNKKEMWL